jgi:biotin--protein ligase
MDSLDHILALNYWVNTINHEGLTGDWTNSCALLVFPHCTHTEPYTRLDADLPTITRIRQFVEGGGSFLGICGGAYFASKTANWGGHQWGSAHLRFWPWLSSGPHLDDGPQTHEFILPFLEEEPYCNLHCDGGGEFVWEGDRRNPPFTPMGCYSKDKYAGVQCAVGSGKAVLWHARLERSFRYGDVQRAFQRTYAIPYDVEVCFDKCFYHSRRS